MPNICLNKLRIYGPADERERFCQETILNQEDQQFNHYVIHNEPHRVYDVQTEIGETYIEIRLGTAWAPPLLLCETASDMYPALVFAILYEESGVDMGGLCIYKATE